MNEDKAPKREQTRTLILETALQLFQDRGYEEERPKSSRTITALVATEGTRAW